jgi:hypothetical protein
LGHTTPILGEHNTNARPAQFKGYWINMHELKGPIMPYILALCLITRAIIRADEMITINAIRAAAIIPINIVNSESDDPGTTIYREKLYLTLYYYYELF